MGSARLVVAGGFESMSRVPYYLPQAARAPGLRLGHAALTDGVILDGLWDPYNDIHMGSIAEACAAALGITRAEQDAYAAASYRRAAVRVLVRGAQRLVVAQRLALALGVAQRLAVAVDDGLSVRVTVSHRVCVRVAVEIGHALGDVVELGGTLGDAVELSSAVCDAVELGGAFGDAVHIRGRNALTYSTSAMRRIHL